MTSFLSHGARAVAAVALLAAAACSLPSPAGPVAAAGEIDRIVYSSFRPANWDIYHFAERGDEPSRLIGDPALDYDAVFSPDGRWLVFTSERRGTPDLYVLDLHDGAAEPRLLIDSRAMEGQPAFSPDGREIAFVSTAAGTADVFRIRFLPERTQRLEMAENLTAHPSGNFRPAYAPDGTRLAFSSDRDGEILAWPAFPFSRQREGDLYLLDLGTRELSRLTDAPGWDGSPAWSSDGSEIFYYSAGGVRRPASPTAATQRGGYRIYAVPSGGGAPRPVSPDGVEALSPAVMPNGRIAFGTRDGSGYEARWSIVSVRPDGSDLRIESDPSMDCWQAGFHPQTGAMVCHGPGPFPESGLQAQSMIAPGTSGPGPLLAPGYPVEREVDGRRIALYAMRHALEVPVHPFRSEIAVGIAAGEAARLVIADMHGNAPREIHSVRGSPLLGMRWSHDGEWITYTTGPFLGAASSARDVWKVRRDGSEPTNVTANPAVNDGMADFSGDGEWIAFRSGRAGSFDLYAMRADGSEVRRLTEDAGRVNHVAFSPVGGLAAFISDRHGAPYPVGGGGAAPPGEDGRTYRTTDLYALEVGPAGEPGRLTRLTDNAVLDAHPRFSPDGRWLLFVSERGGINDEEPLVQELMFSPQMYGDLYAMRLSDGEIVRLTADRWENGTAFWAGPARRE